MIPVYRLGTTVAGIDFDRECDSWSISRSLLSWGLPSGPLSPAGSGSGSGSALVRSGVTKNWDEPEAILGYPVRIDATADWQGHSTVLYRVFSGIVRSMSSPGGDGDLLDLSVEDDMGALNGPARIRAPFAIGSGGMEATAAVESALRDAGYHSVPPGWGDSRCRLWAPFMGNIAAEVGAMQGGETAWDAWYENAGAGANLADAVLTPSGGMVKVLTLSATIPAATAVRVVFVNRGPNNAGTVELRMGSTLVVSLSRSVNTLRATHAGGSVVTLGSLASADVNAAVEVEVTRLSATSCAVRFRTVEGGEVAAWSATATVSGTADPGTSWSSVRVQNGVSGLGVYAGGTPDEIWTPLTTRLRKTGVQMPGVLIPTGATRWQVAQEVAKASGSALWIDEHGIVRLSPLPTSPTVDEHLSGNHDLASRPWDKSRDDTADRLEASWTPIVETAVTDGSIPIWEAGEVLEVPAGGTASTTADLDVAAADLAAWSSPPGEIAPETGSLWAAYPATSGNSLGDRITSGITVNAYMETAQRIRVVVSNSNGFPAFMCNREGSPVLIARANRTLQRGSARTIDRGAPAISALNPGSIDFGTWLQDETQIGDRADALWHAMSNPGRTVTVSVLGKASRRVGQRVSVHEGSSEHGDALSVSGPIIAISNSASAGRWDQQITIAVLGG